MERQARSSGTLELGHLFHRAAWVWKSGTDTYSGSSHNCHAYGLDGAATYGRWLHTSSLPPFPLFPVCLSPLPPCLRFAPLPLSALPLRPAPPPRRNNAP